VSHILFLHSSTDNAPAIALRDGHVGEGWDGLLLDLDPEARFSTRERWERALNEAARQTVLFLSSTAWLRSRMCTNEVSLACGVNKRLLGTPLDGTTIAL
jgi:hypothetical protein